MKNLLTFLAVIIGFIGMAQKSSVIYDDVYNVAISKAQVFNASNEFQGMSNEKGVIDFEGTIFPIEIKHYAYEALVVNDWTDTIKLSPKFQEVEEVKFSPVNKMDLYEEIIENSSKNIDRSEGALTGVYFESVMIVCPERNDTVYLDNLCDLTIKKVPSKKKMNYELYCSNGKSSYRNEASNMEEFDTSIVNMCLKFVKPFKKTLKYDLTSSKNFELKFEENQITRNVEGELHKMVFENDDKYRSIVSTSYKGLQLYTWDNKTVREKPYNGEKIFVNYHTFGRYVDFSVEPSYFLNSVVVNGFVQMAAEGDFYEIYVVKGFVQNNNVTANMEKSFSEVEKYFETIPNSNEGKSYYTFDLKK